MKTNFLLVAALWLLIGCEILQVSCSTYELKYKPVVFDDQYIGCSDELSSEIMPKILIQERSNRLFNIAWENATTRWSEIESGLDLPDEFEDEHGIALLVFSNKYPEDNPIYQQFNGNLSIAGASRKAYMDKFRFKALHFYLTRALQILKPDCSKNYTTFRGSHDTFRVSPIFKFGRFTSTSLNSIEAVHFGYESFFNITTCFGASIGKFSFFPDEQEVLIPPTEKFIYVDKGFLKTSKFFLESSGQMCSYFNCAIMGAEKQDNAVCYPGSGEKSKTSMTSTSPAELEERIAALEDLIVRNHDKWVTYDLQLGMNFQQLTESLSANTKLSTDTDKHINDLQDNLKTIMTSISTLSESLLSQAKQIAVLVSKAQSSLPVLLEDKMAATDVFVTLSRRLNLVQDRVRSLEVLDESVSEAQSSIEVFQEDKTAANKAHRTLSRRVDLLQEKVRTLEEMGAAGDAESCRSAAKEHGSSTHEKYGN